MIFYFRKPVVVAQGNPFYTKGEARRYHTHIDKVGIRRVVHPQSPKRISAAGQCIPNWRTFKPDRRYVQLLLLTFYSSSISIQQLLL